MYNFTNKCNIFLVKMRGNNKRLHKLIFIPFFAQFKEVDINCGGVKYGPVT